MMLMNREMRTKLPTLKSSKSYDDKKVKQTDARAKQQAKEYADRKRWAEEKDFKIGEKVLLRQLHKNKYSTQFCSDPFTIIKINGSQLEIQDKHGQIYKRNSAHTKRYYESEENREEEEEIENPAPKELPQPNPQPEEETQPQSSQTNPFTSPPQEPIPSPAEPKRRTTRISKPPERLRY